MTISYVPRVTQLDAAQLDQELIELMKQKVFEATKLFSPGLLTPILPELELCLRTVIFKYSVFDTKCTFGQQMLMLKYNENLISKSKIYWLYGYLVVLKYFKDRSFHSFTRNINLQAWIQTIEQIELIGDILNFLRFIKSGKCPMLVDYLLNLEITAEKISREDLTDLSWTRELLWNNFIELFGSILSITNMFSLKNKFNTILRKFWKQSHMKYLNSEISPTLSFNTLCAYCESKLVLPHHFGCGHVFCYYCVTSNKMANADFCCPRCNVKVGNIKEVLVSSDQ